MFVGRLYTDNLQTGIFGEMANNMLCFGILRGHNIRLKRFHLYTLIARKTETYIIPKINFLDSSELST